MLRPLLGAVLAFVVSLSAGTGDRATLSGKVTDGAGKPIENATVMIYHAGVKQGYSTFCPSCYVDCGKRATTDRAGSFNFTNLDPDLWFELLVIRDGYTATFVNRADPAQQPIPTAVLAPRAPVNDPGRVVRGRVVGPAGRPLPAAVVLPLGVSTEEGSMYGTIDSLEPIAVTNAQGEFELADSAKAKGMLLDVEARGMAPRLIAIPTGVDRKTVMVADGAVVRGRLVNKGKPVAGAELGLIARDTGGYGADLKIIGNPYEEIRIGTQPDGSFIIPNVPAGVEWYVYGKMESVATLGATAPVKFTTARDGDEVNVGDIEIRSGYRLGGRVTLSDGAAIAEGMRITLGAKDVWDSQTVIIGRDGRFGFQGIPAGQYEISSSVRGYHLYGDAIDIAVDRDRADLAITLAPGHR
jgi:hypothetical protein